MDNNLNVEYGTITNQAQKIKNDMVKDFLWWAKYNPTLVKERYGCSIRTLEDIIRYNLFKK